MAKKHTAQCACGAVKFEFDTDPTFIAVCHCLDCKKRSGSAFAVQARWPKEQVTIEGRSKSFVKRADSDNLITFNFCPDCGSDVHYSIEGKFDGLVAIPLGAFDDPFFAAPSFSVWDLASVQRQEPRPGTACARPPPRRPQQPITPRRLCPFRPVQATHGNSRRAADVSFLVGNDTETPG